MHAAFGKSSLRRKAPDALLTVFTNRVENENASDFSVVRFRSDFMPVSEKNYMKVHRNQWLLARPYAPKHFSRVTHRGQTTAPEVQKPSQ
jgi:hypothetical protein